MDSKNYDLLRLENMLSFPLYACSKEIIKQYKPYLDKLDLTYTQYITMLALWEHQTLTVKDLGQYLYLDSGTLTPLLKKLENKGFITRKRSESDERNVIVRITDTGKQLQDEALMIPEKILSLTTMDQEELKSLYHILNKLLKYVE